MEIEEMLNENGEFNLDNIQVLLDELVYYFDINEENKEDLKQYKEDTNTYVKLYNEYNRKMPEIALLIKGTEEKIDVLNQKQQRLNGRISKRDFEEKASLEKQLNDLKKEYQETKDNKKEAKRGYNETKAKYEELVVVNKEGQAKKEHEKYASMLENICKYCLSEKQKLENEITKIRENINYYNEKLNQIDISDRGQLLEINNNIKNENEKLQQAIEKLVTLSPHYDKVIEMIAKSDEYQGTVSKDIVTELKQQLEEEAKEIKEPTKEEPTKEEPTKEEPTVEEPTKEEPTVEEPTVEEPTVEEPTVEEPTVEEPTVEEPTVEEPTVEEPTVEEPTVEEPTVEEPTVEEPTVEEPTVEEPTVEEPTVEEPTVEEPTVEEPTVEEPTVEEPTVEEPTIEEPTVEEPIVEEPTVEEPKSYSERLEALAKEAPLFKDESRIDPNHSYMSYQNASNLGYVNNGTIEMPQPEPQKNDEKVGFFERIKEKFTKEDKKEDTNVREDENISNEIYGTEQPQNIEDPNEIVNIDYVPETLKEKIEYKVCKFMLPPEKFDEWLATKSNQTESMVR